MLHRPLPCTVMAACFFLHRSTYGALDTVYLGYPWSRTAIPFVFFLFTVCMSVFIWRESRHAVPRHRSPAVAAAEYCCATLFTVWALTLGHDLQRTQDSMPFLPQGVRLALIAEYAAIWLTTGIGWRSLLLSHGK